MCLTIAGSFAGHRDSYSILTFTLPLVRKSVDNHLGRRQCCGSPLCAETCLGLGVSCSFVHHVILFRNDYNWYN